MQSNNSRGKGGIAVFLLSCWSLIAAADSLGRQSRFFTLDLVRAGIGSLEDLPALEMQADTQTNAGSPNARSPATEKEAQNYHVVRLGQIQLAEVQSQASLVDRCKRQSGLFVSRLTNTT